MNFWRKGVGLEYMLFIARSLELLALPCALNRSPRAAASFNEPDRANRRRPLAFRKRVGEAGITGFTAAVAHLECSASVEERKHKWK